ncbi:MAG: hypothetical protein IKC47_01340 [Clostridia bacterium]|nr:hypothetical protein [Clostridia bacterium]
MNKTAIVLDIYDDLRIGEVVNSGVCRKRYGISESTFYRYISEIRAHVWETQTIDVVFDVKRQTYVVERKKINMLSALSTAEIANNKEEQ